MKVLLTGGAGFIGSAVTRTLLDHGHKVLVCDNMATGLRSNIDARCEFYEIGAESPKILDIAQTFGVEVIAHIGGNSSGEIGEIEPLNDNLWNVTSTLNLLTIAQKLKIKKFVYASSMGVYGQSDGENKLREVDQPLPISIYGSGKLCAEQYLKTFAGRNIQTTALRMFNVYGPGQNLSNPKQGMISIYMEQRLRGPKVIVRGSVDRVRDFVYIDDVCSFWLAILTNTNVKPEFSAINISTGIGTKVSRILELLGHCAGSIDIEIQENTPADQNAVIGDNTVAKNKFGWTPQVSIEEGIKRMWSWAQNQKRSEVQS